MLIETFLSKHTQAQYMYPKFNVQEQICHRAGSLLLVLDADHKFHHIYFTGNTDEQIDQRCQFDYLERP